MGLAGRLVQPLVVQAAIDLLPPALRARLELPASSLKFAIARPVLRTLAKAAAKAPSREVVQAYERMGRALA